MVKKIKKYLKFVVCCALIMSLVAPSYAALSASDGSAFVTKSEFDAALADFNARLTTFEAGINSKIDSQVTSYLDRNGIWNGKAQAVSNSNYYLQSADVCYRVWSGKISSQMDNPRYYHKSGAIYVVPWGLFTANKSGLAVWSVNWKTGDGGRDYMLSLLRGLSSGANKSNSWQGGGWYLKNNIAIIKVDNLTGASSFWDSWYDVLPAGLSIVGTSLNSSGVLFPYVHAGKYSSMSGTNIKTFDWSIFNSSPWAGSQYTNIYNESGYFPIIGIQTGGVGQVSYMAFVDNGKSYVLSPQFVSAGCAGDGSYFFPVDGEGGWASSSVDVIVY